MVLALKKRLVETLTHSTTVNHQKPEVAEGSYSPIYEVAETEFDVKSMSLSQCLILISTFQADGAGGLMAWGMLSLLSVGLLTPINHGFNTRACWSISDDHVHLFIHRLYEHDSE